MWRSGKEGKRGCTIGFRTLSGHMGWRVAVREDERKLEVCSGSHTIHLRTRTLLHAHTRTCMRAPHPAPPRVVSVEFIAQSHLLVTASHDATARVWDGDSGKCLHVLQGHQGVCVCARACVFTYVCACVCLRVCVCLTRGLPHRILSHFFPPPPSISPGRLNKVVVDASGESAVTCSDDQTSRVWNLHTGECTRVLEGHGAWVSGAAVTRGGGRIVTISGDSTGTLWDAATGEREGGGRRRESEKSEGGVMSMGEKGAGGRSGEGVEHDECKSHTSSPPSSHAQARPSLSSRATPRVSATSH